MNHGKHLVGFESDCGFPRSDGSSTTDGSDMEDSVTQYKREEKEKQDVEGCCLGL